MEGVDKSMNNAILEYVQNEQVTILKKYIELKKQFSSNVKIDLGGAVKSLVKQLNDNNEFEYNLTGKRR